MDQTKTLDAVTAFFRKKKHRAYFLVTKQRDKKYDLGKNNAELVYLNRNFLLIIE